MCADKVIKIDIDGITPGERLQEDSRKYSFFWDDDGRSIKKIIIIIKKQEAEVSRTELPQKCITVQ